MAESQSGSEAPDPDQLRVWVDADEAVHGLDRLLAERGDDAAIAELRALADTGHRGAATQLIRLLAGKGDQTAIAELRARAEAGDRDAAGRLGEELARQGDLDGALRVWVQAYGEDSPTTRRLAELRAERSGLADAVRAWLVSDVVHQNSAGSHMEYLDTLDHTARMEMNDEPEDWGFMESEELARLLAERGDEAAIAELRARSAGWPWGPAGQQLARLLAERGDEAAE